MCPCLAAVRLICSNSKICNSVTVSTDLSRKAQQDRTYLYIMTNMYWFKISSSCFLAVKYMFTHSKFLKKINFKIQFFPFPTFFLVLLSTSCSCSFTSNCVWLSKQSIGNTSQRKQMVLLQIFSPSEKWYLFAFAKKVPFFHLICYSMVKHSALDL